MAITRAQQAKQMLREGGRLGYRFGGEYQGRQTGRAAPTGFSATQAAANVGKASTAPSGGGGGGGNQNTQYTDRIMDVAERKRRQDLRDLATRQAEDKAQEPFETLVIKDSNFPGIIGMGLNAIAPFRQKTLDRNVDYFRGLKSRGKLDKPRYSLTAQGYKNYMSDRLAGKIDAAGNPISRFDDDSDDNQILFPYDIEDNTGGGGGGSDDADDEDDTNTGGLALRFRKDGGRINAMDGGMMSPVGGIMDLETGRQMYFLGKLVKKATRAVKKITKSPLGKAALGIAALKFAPSFLKSEGLKNFFLTDPSKGFSLSNLFGKGLTTKGAMAGIAALSAAPLLFGQEEEEEDDEFYRGPGLDTRKIRENPYDFLGPNFADGGRIGYQEGSKEPVAKKTMPLLDMGGKEMDLREDGGFVPIGRMERADDVPARLSKNEFVFTADAVRNAGEGDVDKGAEVMYNMMKNLESGGEVSEESQGLQGAREMFQTSKRLEEVL